MPPGVGYYGGAPNAFAGGAMFQRDRRALDYQENALRALIERFGPEAGDPTAWGQVQGIDQRRQLFPYEIAAQEHLVKTRPYEIGRLEHEKALYPHELGAAERRTDAYNALTDEFGPVAGDAGAHAIQEAQNKELRGAALNAARALQAAKAKGGDLGTAFDRTVAVLRGIGLPAEAIAGFREQIVSDPDFVDEFVAMLSGTVDGTGRRAVGNPTAIIDAQGNPRLLQTYTDGSREVIPDVAPAQTVLGQVRLGQGQERLEQGWRQLSLEEARMRGFDAPVGHQIWEGPDGQIEARPIPGTAEAREAEDRDRRITEEEFEARRAAEEQVEIATLALNALSNTRAQLDRFGALQGGSGPVGRATRSIGGLPVVQAITDVGRYKDEVQTLLSHIAIDRLASIKATGATLGQITAPELAMLRASMGNLEAVGRDPELIRKDLDTIERILSDAQARAEAALRNGGSPPPPPPDDDLEELLGRYLPGPGGGQ